VVQKSLEELPPNEPSSQKKKKEKKTKTLKQLPQVYLQEKEGLKKKVSNCKFPRVPLKKEVSKKCSKEGPSSVPSKKKAQVSNVCAPPYFHH
jgi:hypothetical protein